MDAEEHFTVRDTCSCGHEYAIRDPSAGHTFACPACGRSITITEADILVAPRDDLLPIEPDPEPATTDPYAIAEAVPIDDIELRPAGHGAREGVTGRVEYDSEEARVHAAVAGRPLMAEQDASDFGGSGTANADQLPRRGPTNIYADMLSSLYFVGYPNNAFAILGTGGGIAVLYMLAAIIPLPFSIAFWVLAMIASSAIVHFFWNTMTETARGEDEIPWVDADWDWWEDVLRPLGWLILITLICALPMLLIFWYVPASPNRALAMEIAFWAGFFFFPAAVMSVGIGESVWFLRPDLLGRCVWAIGPAYLAASALVFGIYELWKLWRQILEHVGAAGWLTNALLITPLSILVQAYLGYVMFRTFGLLFRYYRHKLPWKF